MIAERFIYGFPRSLESRRLPAEFDAFAFTIPYEGQLPLAYNMLQALSSASSQKFFTIVGGSSPTSNPDIYLEFFDAVYVGELEPSVHLVVDALLEPSSLLSSVPGIFVREKESFQRVYADNLNTIPHLVKPIISDVSPITEGYPLEVSRGCPMSCKFCIGRVIYSPFRWRSLSVLKDIAERIVESTGVKRLTLIGAGLSYVPHLPQMLEWLVNKGIGFSLPSVTPSLIFKIHELIQYSGSRTITFAPETPSETLRRHIGKAIGNEEYFQAAFLLRKRIKNIKLYFMFGLPDERKEDLTQLQSFVEKFVHFGFQKRNIKISATPFVPKKGTPFEDEGMPSLEELERKAGYFRRLRKEGYVVSIYPLKAARAQAVISLGDRKIGRLLKLLIHKYGVRGWLKLPETELGGSILQR
ncbi:hypothetical protein B6U74_00820 [Candidatus Bathyarchaeota archaeon ex4484_205]|nr:MAG: hypothetical protein B6U74_00820 [Candidatus Bathyarchaeota archaeon ex4484_205]